MSKLADIAFAVWDFLFGDEEACRWTMIGGFALIFIGVALPLEIARWVILTGFSLDLLAAGVMHYRRDQQVKLERKRKLTFQVPPLRDSVTQDAVTRSDAPAQDHTAGPS